MTEFGKDLIASLADAVSYAKGERGIDVIVHEVDVDDVDIKAIRNRLKLTQDDMALVLGTSLSGYRKWEQGKRRPSGAARTLFKVMEREPEAVLRALAPVDQ